MPHPPIKRSHALQPFSREHLLGLSVALDLRRAPTQGHDAVAAALRRVVAAWDDELRGHFDDEERLLTPHIDDPSLAERLRAEHAQIAELVAQAASISPADAVAGALAATLGDLLHDHIRWEERTLFPAVESRLDDDAAKSLGRETAAFSATRISARTASQRRDMGGACGTRWDVRR